MESGGNSSKHVALITPCPMSYTNGIGVQLHTMVAEGFPPHHHFWFWGEWSIGVSSVSNSTELGRLYRLARGWPWRVGRGFITRLAQPFNPVHGGSLRKEPFRRTLSRLGKQFGFAYVTPIREEDALAMLGMVEELGCPYVVHIWDLCHHEPCINPQTMPSMTKLLRDAEAVYCLTREMEEWIAPVRSSDGLLSFGRRPPAALAQAPLPNANLRLAVMGDMGIYRSGINILQSAWPRIAALPQSWTLVYLGTVAQMQVISGIVGQRLEYHGFVSNEERDRLLRSCHAAFLPGPCEDPQHEMLARFSVPSRTSDYLLHGLPVLANFHPASAARGFFTEVLGTGVRLVREADALVQELSDLSRPATWREASNAALAFANARLDSRVLRDRIMTHARPHLVQQAD